MAYTILVCEDNTLYGSHKERIMQRSKLVDKLVFIVDPIYKGIDMSDATVMLEYVLPISREYKTVLLALSNERYKDCFLQYKLPFDVDLTSQAGSLELQLTFAYVEMSPNGTGVQHVRKTSSTTIDIIPITAWSDIVPDRALSCLDQRLIKMDATMRAMNDYLDVIDNNMVDNLIYDGNNETLQLSANGVGVGNRISVRDILEDGTPVVDLDKEFVDGSGNDSDNKDGCDCDCDCENSVVEFGYFSDGTGILKPNKPEEDDDNVIDF
jgi:hypothetical protein